MVSYYLQGNMSYMLFLSFPLEAVKHLKGEGRLGNGPSAVILHKPSTKVNHACHLLMCKTAIDTFLLFYHVLVSKSVLCVSVFCQPIQSN